MHLEGILCSAKTRNRPANTRDNTLHFPPKPFGFVADIVAPLLKQIFDIPIRQTQADIHHDCRAADLLAHIEVLERAGFGDARAQSRTRPFIKPSSFDTARLGDFPELRETAPGHSLPRLPAIGGCASSKFSALRFRRSSGNMGRRLVKIRDNLTPE
jgi:hypothetical protein